MLGYFSFVGLLLILFGLTKWIWSDFSVSLFFLIMLFPTTVLFKQLLKIRKIKSEFNEAKSLKYDAIDTFI
jgi:hypothetical protein